MGLTYHDVIQGLSKRNILHSWLFRMLNDGP